MKITAENSAEGTVFNPQTVGVGHRIRFEYELGSFFECYLERDGSLRVRISGLHSDLLATHHHVANDIAIVARRYSPSSERHEDFVNE